MRSLAWSIIRSVSKLPAGSAPPRRWLPAPARRDALGDRLFREKQSKQGLPRRCFCSAIADKAETKKAAADESNPTVETTMATQDLHCHYHMPIFPGSSHRDGAIYKKRLEWESDYGVDITDRTETLLKPSYVDDMTCEMLQIFSLKLAKSPVTASASNGSIELYGFMAARDEYDLKLNYVFNRGREDPVVVQEGSLIQMTGPRRGIAFHCDVLLEFDMRIKNGEREEDDAQLIDGMSEVRGMFMPWEPTPVRLDGDCGAVEVSSALVSNAVAAIVEVIVVSDVRSGLDLSLSSVICAVEAHEFQLFHGSVGDWCGERRRFAIAVTVDTMMHLKFVAGHKGSNGNVKRRCSFRAKINGQVSRRIKLELASILVKVTWAAWPYHMFC
ncbi:hypothetical protein CFC21_104014 [Triticum aestivum]|uniref:DUF6598 domain-containing protein n=3 Tax=Triticum TaxID=4564 RepID=A0A9R1C2X0_TRITD|nr:hypothetical protein CFC21_104014 [Triticum aestivum]VAI90288.1 unnamed protein product [Triticum turgidum subsp. durum]